MVVEGQPRVEWGFAGRQVAFFDDAPVGGPWVVRQNPSAVVALADGREGTSFEESEESTRVRRRWPSAEFYGAAGEVTDRGQDGRLVRIPTGEKAQKGGAEGFLTRPAWAGRFVGRLLLLGEGIGHVGGL